MLPIIALNSVASSSVSVKGPITGIHSSRGRMIPDSVEKIITSMLGVADAVNLSRTDKHLQSMTTKMMMTCAANEAKAELKHLLDIIINEISSRIKWPFRDFIKSEGEKNVPEGTRFECQLNTAIQALLSPKGPVTSLRCFIEEQAKARQFEAPIDALNNIDKFEKILKGTMSIRLKVESNLHPDIPSIEVLKTKLLEIRNDLMNLLLTHLPSYQFHSLSPLYQSPRWQIENRLKKNFEALNQTAPAALFHLFDHLDARLELQKRFQEIDTEQSEIWKLIKESLKKHLPDLGLMMFERLRAIYEPIFRTTGEMVKDHVDDFIRYYCHPDGSLREFQQGLDLAMSSSDKLEALEMIARMQMDAKTDEKIGILFDIINKLPSGPEKCSLLGMLFVAECRLKNKNISQSIPKMAIPITNAFLKAINELGTEWERRSYQLCVAGSLLVDLGMVREAIKIADSTCIEELLKFPYSPSVFSCGSTSPRHLVTKLLGLYEKIAEYYLTGGEIGLMFEWVDKFVVGRHSTSKNIFLFQALKFLAKTNDMQGMEDVLNYCKERKISMAFVWYNINLDEHKNLIYALAYYGVEMPDKTMEKNMSRPLLQVIKEAKKARKAKIKQETHKKAWFSAFYKQA